MIRRLEIKKLFGRFSYNIILKENALTILTGPNGFGKSTILKIIEAFNKFDIKYFNTIKFDQIDIYFDDDAKAFSITQSKNGIKINGQVFEKEFREKNNIIIHKSLYFNYYNECLNIPKLDTNNMRPVEKRVYDIDEEQFNKWINKANNIKNSKSKSNKKLYNVIMKIKESIIKIYFIKEQRLIREDITNDKSKVINVIEDIPNKFKRLIGNLSENYSRIANQLDNTYPSRLFDTEKGIDKDEYQCKMQEMSKRFEKLKEYDISDMQAFSNVIFKDEHSKALKVYFDDFDKKYSVYEKHILMCDLYTQIVNERLSFKRVSISKEKGLSVYDIDNKMELVDLNKLSSGEKQEIVLFFELIFDTPNDILLLIDEPEISLHISWQKMFIDDLLKIAKFKNFKIILATHSPQIISNHWDNQIDLGELYGC